MRRNSLLIVTTALIVIALMVVIYAFHREAEGRAVRDIRDRQQAAARAISAHLTSWLEERSHDVRSIANAVDARMDSADVIARAFADSPSGAGIVAIAVYDSRGRLVTSAGNSPPTLPAGMTPFNVVTARVVDIPVQAVQSAGPVVQMTLRFPSGTLVANMAVALQAAADAGHATAHAGWQTRISANDGTILYDSARPVAAMSQLQRFDALCSRCHMQTAGSVRVPARPSTVAENRRRGDEIVATAAAQLDGVTLTTAVSSPRAAVGRDVERDIVLTWLLFAALAAALSITWLTTYRTYQQRIRAEEAVRSWEERHAMQRAVAEAEQRYGAIVESSHDSILVTDLEGVVTFANRQAKDVFRNSPGPFESVPPSVRESMRAAIHECAAGGVVAFEAPVARADGERFFSFKAVPFLEDGAVAGVVVSGRDLTEMRRDEELVRESERRLRTMLDDSDTLAALAGVDSRMTYCSAALRRLLGIASDDDLRRPWLEFVAPEDRESVKAGTVAHLASGGFARHAEYSVMTGDRDRRLIRWTRTILRDDAGRPVGMGTVGQDLTARRLSEERVTKLKDFYQRILESTVAGVVVTDRSDRPVYMNASFSRGTGLTVDFAAPEAADGNLFERIPAFATAYATAKGQLRPASFEGVPVVRPDGVSRWHSGWMVPLTTDGSFDGMICTTEDVSDRIGAEIALGSLKRQHEDLVSTVPGIVWQADARTLQVEFVSPYAEQLLGYPAAQWYEPDFWVDHIHPDDRDGTVQETVAVTAGAAANTLEYRFVAADGRAVWLRDAVRLIQAEGRPAKLRGVIVDITEQKKIESALAESESRFRALFEQSAIGIAVQGHDRSRLETNLAFRKMFGDSGEDFSPTAAAGAAGAALKTVIGQMFDALWTGQETSVRREEGFERRSGKQIWCRITASVILGENDAPRMTVALLEDITERKLAEEVLHHSRARFRHLLEITTDLVWEVDPHEVYTYVGPRVREILGYAPEEIVGRSPYDFMPPDEAARMRSAFGSLVSERKPFALIENVNVHRDGHLVILESSGVPVYDENGEFTGYHGIDRDVTAREESKRAGKRLATAIEQSTEVVIVTDRQGRIEYVNPAFETISGYRRDEVLGLTPRILKSGVQSDEFYLSLWAQLLSGKPWSGRFVNRKKDGTTYEVDAGISPIFGEDDEISGFVALQRDRTEHLALLERLHRAEEMERVGRLISGVAHEVRNPLNAIQAALSALELDLAHNEENEQLFRAVRSQVTRMADLMRELLEFSKPIEQSRVEVCSVDVLCAESIALWRSSHPRQPPERVQLEPLGSPGLLKVEPGRMHQVLINLLDNAHEHSPAGAEVVVRVERDNDQFRIKIVDGGSGIRPEHLAKVFDPFFTTRRRGTGLGLSVVKNIVEQYGGLVVLRNNDRGPGCTAEIIMTACAAVEEPENACEPAAR